jgi:hypothetical protein
MLRDRPSMPEERVQLFSARARSRARASMFSEISHQKESLLRSRIAITLMLVFGFAFSGAGVGLAVTGVTSEGQSAANVQYPPPAPTTDTPAPNTPTPTLEPETEVIGETDETPKGDKAPDSEDAAPVEETRQLGAEAGGEELPFTGFAAIPVLLLGFALLTSGFVLRRGNGRSSD